MVAIKRASRVFGLSPLAGQNERRESRGRGGESRGRGALHDVPHVRLGRVLGRDAGGAGLQPNLLPQEVNRVTFPANPFCRGVNGFAI